MEDIGASRGDRMSEQQITWGWALRILLGAVWRWLLACLAVTIGVVAIEMTIKSMGGPDLAEHPAQGETIAILWLLALFWAFCAALRAKHGGYRLMLVSGQGSLEAFD